MTLRLTALALLVVGFGLPAWADDKAPDPKKSAKDLAQKSNDALLKGDYATVTALTHPRVVKELGGKKRAVEVMKSAMKEMKDKGFEIRSVMVGEPTDPVSGGGALYLIVPITMVIKVPSGKATQSGFLIGVSEDRGTTWAFIDGSAEKGNGELKKLIPDLPASLNFPKKLPPKFEKD